MSNSLAKFTLTLAYGGITPPPFVVSAPYQGSAISVIDVPDADPSGTEHAIDFGSVSKATLVLLRNRTGQELEIYFGDAADPSFNLPPGGILPIVADTVPAANELASMKVKTTALQSGAGYIDAYVFGDPV